MSLMFKSHESLPSQYHFVPSTLSCTYIVVSKKKKIFVVHFDTKTKLKSEDSKQEVNEYFDRIGQDIPSNHTFSICL